MAMEGPYKIHQFGHLIPKHYVGSSQFHRREHTGWTLPQALYVVFYRLCLRGLSSHSFSVLRRRTPPSFRQSILPCVSEDPAYTPFREKRTTFLPRVYRVGFPRQTRVSEGSGLGLYSAVRDIADYPVGKQICEVLRRLRGFAFRLCVSGTVRVSDRRSSV
ncbi:hypothetical protein SAY86_020476 [Trapa natans]|uniref:Uncharacterized protein n=1 Tax=Trapa natans TaxID=22666 RepID=A0AAN7LZE8_TRANT|nr:hypothetical protein SAY86_020476 [Trapa natans]